METIKVSFMNISNGEFMYGELAEDRTAVRFNVNGKTYYRKTYGKEFFHMKFDGYEWEINYEW